MIIESVTLHNFGLYGGRQTIALGVGAERPVVLFGGMNGLGKTTFAHALQIALYGRDAPCIAASRQPWGEAMRDYIHRGAGLGEGTSVQVDFSRDENGARARFSVRRRWDVRASGIREHLEVRRDGVPDPSLTERWAAWVEKHFPSRIADLFFIDGEKIAEFADLDRLPEVLGAAVNTLLGGDVALRLAADIAALEQRERRAGARNVDQPRIDALRTSLDAGREEDRRLADEAATIEARLAARKKELRKLDADYDRQGGALFEQRRGHEARLAEVGGRIEALQRAMLAGIAGPAPFLLARDLLQSLNERAAAEREAAAARDTLDLLAKRDAALLAQLAGQDEAAVKRLRALMSADRRKRSAAASSPVLLDLEPSGWRALARMEDTDFDGLGAGLAALLEEHRALAVERNDLARRLDDTPDEDTLQGVLSARAATRQAIAALEARLAEIAVLREAIGERLARDEAAMVGLYGVVSAGEDAQRIIAACARIRGSAEAFRVALVRRRVGHIQERILACFQTLLRKQTLVCGLEIDPANYAVRVIGREGQALPLARLSAGERQLLAIAMLWGLAQASGRELPVVIDTPLSRLDSSHRGKVVEAYFPHAGRQVLVLSTDEEIDQGYFEKLRPAIGRTYRLAHDEARELTTVEEGYFRHIELAGAEHD